jgi:hypothetical protein
MTPREVFDRVKAHLLAQGKKAANGPGEGCQYRTRGGLKCAVGCLIPDDVYDPTFEGVTMRNLSQYARPLGPTMRFRAVLQQLGLLEHAALLRDLQSLHDQQMVTEWPRLLDGIEANVDAGLYNPDFSSKL